jgi:hypothetical protein
MGLCEYFSTDWHTQIFRAVGRRQVDAEGESIDCNGKNDFNGTGAGATGVARDER